MILSMNPQEQLTIQYGIHTTPFGPMVIGLLEGNICTVAFLGTPTVQNAEACLKAQWKDVVLKRDQKRTAVYLTKIFASKPVALLMKGTPFQMKVWDALRDIPRGETRTYTEIAKAIGKPRAVRAVGTACGKNALAVVIPCHRVVGAQGSGGGYRWGLKRKKALLASERA